MKSKLLLILVVLSIFVSSCVVTESSTSKTLDIYGAGVVQNPVLVDLDVKEKKIEGKSEGLSSELESVKQKAIANAIENANADVLVEPKYKTVVTNGRVTATVTGFPATYTNFRPIKEKDIKLIESGITQKAEVHQPVKQSKTKKKGAGAVFGVLGGTAALALLVLLL